MPAVMYRYKSKNKTKSPENKLRNIQRSMLVIIFQRYKVVNIEQMKIREIVEVIKQQKWS